MNNDFWRQWQALAAVGPFPWRTGGNPSPGFAPFAESAEHFAAALREFTAAAERAAQPSATASQTAFAAAEQFGNFLRDHFAATMKPLAAGAGRNGYGRSRLRASAAVGTGTRTDASGGTCR